jgi:hypothetical protein
VKPPKKALVIFSYVLSPDRDAGSLRMYNLLKRFKTLSWDVTFAVADLQSTPAQRGFLEAIDVELLEKSSVSSIEAHVEAHGPGFDLVILSAISVVLKYLSLVRKYAGSAKVVFDTTDLQHIREFRRARVTGESGWLGIALRSKKWELAAVEAADCTLVVSPIEREILEAACPRPCSWSATSRLSATSGSTPRPISRKESWRTATARSASRTCCSTASRSAKSM